MLFEFDGNVSSLHQKLPFKTLNLIKLIRTFRQTQLTTGLESKQINIQT